MRVFVKHESKDPGRTLPVAGIFCPERSRSDIECRHRRSGTRIPVTGPDSSLVIRTTMSGLRDSVRSNLEQGGQNPKSLLAISRTVKHEE